MNLLIFFAIPLATILLAIVLENILDNPVLVAITFFAVYLVIAVALVALGAITDLATALIAVIVYTIIAFITAYLVRLFMCLCERYFNSCLCRRCPENSNNNNNNMLATSNLTNNNLMLSNNETNLGNEINILNDVNTTNSNGSNVNCTCRNNNRNFFNWEYNSKFNKWRENWSNKRMLQKILI